MMILKLSRMDSLKPIGLKDKAGRVFQFSVPELVQEELHQIDLGAGGAGEHPGTDHQSTNLLNLADQGLLEQRKRGRQIAFIVPADLGDRLMKLEKEASNPVAGG